REMQSKLTKRSIDLLEPSTDRQYVFDSELAGFGIAVQPSGTKTFFVQYRVHGGRKARKRRLTIGTYGALTADQARTRARRLLGAFFAYAERQGVRQAHSNPAHVIEAYRETPRERFLTPAEVTRLGHVLSRAEKNGVPPAPRRRRKPKEGPTAKHRPKSADTP